MTSNVSSVQFGNRRLEALRSNHHERINVADHVCPETVFARWNLEGLVICLLKLADRNKWAASAAWTDDGLLLRVHDADLSVMRSYVGTIASGAAKHSWDLTIVEKVRPAEPLPPMDEFQIPWGTVLHGNLTRGLLARLPAGSVVVSNLRDDKGVAIFSREVPATNEGLRTLWAEAKAARAHGRLCRVLWSEIDWPFAVYIPMPEAPQRTPQSAR